MNRRHKACRAPRLQPATPPPPPPPPLPMPLPSASTPLTSSPPFPTRLRHPTTRYPTTRPTVHPPVIAASNLTQPLPPSDEPYFQRLTPPPRDLWPLEFSSRAPLRNFPSLSFLPSSHLFFASRFSTHGSIILPSSSVHPSIYLSIRRIATVAYSPRAR